MIVHEVGHHVQNLLGISDDRLQEQARGYAVPESFTHGTSSQRVSWFQRGIQTGDTQQCNTFARTNR
ncbi:hypothetical protein A6S26_04865 [Nostoc sp. ATCC 43529]|nr:hypothetical protein A6S26_04865 [Nostoc sp. ATCC 43529]